MKAYKRYSTAHKAANGRPIVQITASKYDNETIYIVGDFATYDQLSILRDDGRYVGNVGIAHLDRLGNANWATAQDDKDNSLLEWE